MKYLKSFGRFLYDCYIGDDWKTAASVVAALGIAAVLVATGAVRRHGNRADRLGGHLARFRGEPDRRRSLAPHGARAA